ncbi:MAG: YebC/PmpR family DNA-binding transcriptional regulator [Candidatus Neomarinimicrobiota bacterium]
MSGHSKWAQIKRKKAVLDQKRGKVFTKLIREITVATRLGGGDQDSNSRLRQAVFAAKAANMPAENVKKAIQRGTGELPGVTYEEALFEGYGPGGVAIMIFVTTDNRNRTVADLRHLMAKYGGNLGEQGCVSWVFYKGGFITVDKDGVDEASLLEAVMREGGDDVEETDDVFEITSSPENLNSIRDELQRRGFVVKSAELAMIPTNTVRVEGNDARMLLSLMDELEDHDDVQSVSSNFDVEDALMVEER